MFDLRYINKIQMMIQVMTETYEENIANPSQTRHLIKNSSKKISKHELYKYDYIFNNSYDNIDEEFIAYIMEYAKCFNLKITVWGHSYKHHDKLLF